MSKFGYLIATCALFGGLAINHIAGNPKNINTTVSVRFCPSTANTPNAVDSNGNHYTSKQFDEAQRELNLKFCRKRYILEKDYFEERSAYDDLPSVEVTPWRNSNTKLIYWLLCTPLLCAIGYTAMWASHANDVDNRHKKLEQFKLDVKKFSAPYRIARERVDNREVLCKEDNTMEDEVAAQAKRLENGWINNEQIETEAKIRERQIAMSLGEMDVAIAKNRSEEQKHVNEKAKLVRVLNKTIESPTATTKEVKEASPIGVSDKVKRQLKEVLKAHEGGWLWEVVNETKPIILTGSMGSGKSWLAVSLALCRKIALGAEVEFIFDRHFEGENEEVWDLLDAKNKAKNVKDIMINFDKSKDHWEQRIKIGKKKLTNKTQTICDEFTNLRTMKHKDIIKDEMEKAAESWFAMFITDPRKACDYGILINHKDTNEAYGHGNRDQREDNTILIKKYSKRGKSIPRVTIVRGLLDQAGNERENVEAHIPRWMTPQNLYAWLTEEVVPKGIDEDYEDEPEVEEYED